VCILALLYKDDRWKRDERGKRTPIYNDDIILGNG
jgi:hypothetical protein